MVGTSASGKKATTIPKVQLSQGSRQLLHGTYTPYLS